MSPLERFLKEAIDRFASSCGDPIEGPGAARGSMRCAGSSGHGSLNSTLRYSGLVSADLQQAHKTAGAIEPMQLCN